MDTDYDPLMHERMHGPMPEPTTKVKSTSSWRDVWNGHQSSRYTTKVPEGVDPYDAAQATATRLGSRPAPSVPWNPSPVVTPSEYPQPTLAMGQPIHVSTASSPDRSEHNVDVTADPGHYLSGVDGTSAGISYSTGVKQSKDGSSKVVTQKQSYGKTNPLLNLARSFVSRVALDPHMSGQQDQAIAALAKPKPEDGTKD